MQKLLLWHQLLSLSDLDVVLMMGFLHSRHRSHTLLAVPDSNAALSLLEPGRLLPKSLIIPPN